MIREKYIIFMVVLFISVVLFSFATHSISTDNNRDLPTNIGYFNNNKIVSINHEHVNVSVYEFVVGWANEPAYAGVFNAVSVEINMFTNGGTNKTPVLGAEVNLTLTISKGGVSTTAQSLIPSDMTPGLYTVPFLPTQAGGTYVTHLNGILGNYTVNDLQINLDNPFSPIDFPSVQSSTPNAVNNQISSLNDQISNLNTILIVSFIFTGLVLVLSLASFYYSYLKLMKK